MTKLKNRLCNAYVPNSNSKSKFFGFDLCTMREELDIDGGTQIVQIKTAEEFLNDYIAVDDVFYRIHGLYKEDNYKEGEKKIYQQTKRKFVIDFFHIEHAKTFLSDLTGMDVNVYSY